jgi:copper chaperone
MMEARTVHVPNISCNHCVMTIEREVGDMEGVAKVSADVDTKNITVEWESPATWDAVKALLAEINYPPE